MTNEEKVFDYIVDVQSRLTACDVHNKLIAKKLKLTLTEVYNAKAFLVKNGYIEIDHKGRYNTSNLHTFYSKFKLL